MTENRTENADVVATTITHAKNCLLRHLVSDTQARSKIVEVIFYIEIGANSAHPCNPYIAGVQIKQSAITCAVDILRINYVPSQSIVNCKFRGDAPSVLAIEKPALLAFCRIGYGAGISLERCYIT